jgi:hypothetical protein
LVARVESDDGAVGFGERHWWDGGCDRDGLLDGGLLLGGGEAGGEWEEEG